MKNRLLFLLLFIILFISFIITGAYYLLVLIVLLISLILISLLSMLLFSNKIVIKMIEKNNNIFLIYESKGLPIGKLSVDLNIKNTFYNEIYQNQFDIILGEKKIVIQLPFTKIKLGNYVINEQSFILSDFLGLFKKKIKKEIFSEMIQYPNLKNLIMDYKVSEEVNSYQSNKSDDYYIREYRIGDSLKDIHYKLSYKLSNYMIKEKHNNKGNNISVSLDLSGNNEECEQVFIYLNQMIQNLQVYHETCLVKWLSKDKVYEQKVTDLDDLNNCITKILSMPKCENTPKMKCTWIITPFGLKQGGNL